MVECQLSAAVPQRTTVGALWQAMSGHWALISWIGRRTFSR